MKELTTITEQELLEAARHTIFMRWVRRVKAEKSTVDKMMEDRYRKQLDELDARIDELEAAE